MRTLVRLTTVFLAAVGLAIGALAAGAPANAQANSTGEVTLTVTELPGQVRLMPGEKIELTLQTNRTTGYQWSASTTGKREKPVSAQARSTHCISSAASDVYKRQDPDISTLTVIVMKESCED